MQISLELDYYLLMALAILPILLYLLYREFSFQKHYYKKIIDNSTNIVMLSNPSGIIEVNKTFFKYFKSFRDINHFSQEHQCVCEFFEKEDGCLDMMYDGQMWVDFLVTHQGTKHKAKINIDGEIYYFLASASSIDKKRSINAIILTDISEQVKTKKALMLLTLNDTLTNVGNRRYFDQKLKEHIVLSERYNTPFSLLVVDIDYFKKINDRYGHDVGDKVLIEFSTLIRSSLREGDVFARVGGEEFAILLPLTTKDKAYVLAQKLREVVQDSKGIAPITMSAGLVQYEKGDDEKLIFKRADAVLYKAKEGGRNKVVLG
ncbi:MAG: GGDEF domain-containing protein [Campylobacterales bacterium]|nr:GGDEF domain-containing protein [Campylobacterales bacterium]